LAKPAKSPIGYVRPGLRIFRLSVQQGRQQI